MNDTLIANWNRKVSKNDNIYILGDIAFPKNKEQIDEIINIIRKLNGNKYLITGNHDWKLLLDDRFVKEFKKIAPYMDMYIIMTLIYLILKIDIMLE